MSDRDIVLRGPSLLRSLLLSLLILLQCEPNSASRFLFSASRSKSCGRTGLPSVNLSCFHCFGLLRLLGAVAAAGGGDDGGVCGEPLLPPRCLDFCRSSAIWSERMRFSGIFGAPFRLPLDEVRLLRRRPRSPLLVLDLLFRPRLLPSFGAPGTFFPMSMPANRARLCTVLLSLCVRPPCLSRVFRAKRRIISSFSLFVSSIRVVSGTPGDPPPPPAEPFRFLSLALLPPLFRFRPVLFFFFPGSGGVCGRPRAGERDRLARRFLCAPAAAAAEAAGDLVRRLLLDRGRFGLGDLDRRSLSRLLSDNDWRRRLREGDLRRPEVLLERDFADGDREPDTDLVGLPRLVASSTDLDRLLLLLLPSLLSLSLLAVGRPLIEGSGLRFSTSTTSSSSSPEWTDLGGEGGVLGIVLEFPPFFLFLFFLAAAATTFLDFVGGSGLFGGSTAFRFFPFPGGSSLCGGGGGVDLRLFSTGDSLVASLASSESSSSTPDRLGVPSLSLWIVTRKFSNFPPPRLLDLRDGGFFARRGGGVTSLSSSSSESSSPVPLCALALVLDRAAFSSLFLRLPLVSPRA